MPEEFFTSIYIMNSDGTNPHPIGEVSHEAFDVEPKVSPDGKRIVFSAAPLRSTPGTRRWRST